MRKITLSLIACCLAGSFAYLISCKKDASPKSFSNNAAITKINTWLEEQKQAKQSSRAANVDLLKSNLEYSNLRFEKSENGEQFLIVPVKDDFKSAAEIEKNTVVDLVLFINKEDNIRSGNIVLYTPGNGIANKIPDNTFYDIFNTAQPGADGKFEFLAVTGKPQYVLQYKNNHLVSSGLYQPKVTAASASRTSSTPCYDWYLVTTWYDANGNVTDQTYVFLYTTCGSCGSLKLKSLCADDGGGGDASCCITDPTAQLTSRQITDPGINSCGMETIEPTTGAHIRNCVHTWYFVTQGILWYTWKYGSTEQSVQVKNGTLWNFRSVTHQGMVTSGTVPPCVTSNCSIASALPSFSGNVANMAIIYSLTLSYPCVVSGGSQSKTQNASTQWFAN
jgi:hypothetical protein